MRLDISFDGLTLKNPLMPASGPLVGDLEKLNFIRDEGVGAVVTKTISSKAAVVPRPCIYGDRYFVMNSELWSEHSKEVWLEDILPNYRKEDAPLIISVGYTKEDMALLIPLLDPYADAFEISTHYVGKDLSVIRETVRTIRAHTTKPIYMKVSPHMDDPVAFARAVREAGASGIAAINSLGPTMKIDLASREIIYGGESGFVWTSGPAIKNLALATVYKIKQAMPDFTVIGVGGVSSAEDVIEFLLAGASGVQMLSAALLRGKDLYSKIIKDLPEALEKYGFSSIEDVTRAGLTKTISYEPVVPSVDTQLCTQCMLCVKICPYFAIRFENQILFDQEKCFGCHLCISKCPVKAIYVESN
ncbi:MAG: 4Fe-4S binding protein [Vallitaleaceae bacterium]|nr:4Fe-4S binding protein [Vallitaleaceae bacterium]